MRRLAFLVLLAIVWIPAAGCEPVPISPTSSVAYSQTDITEGTGATAVAGSIVTLNYTGWLYDSSKPENKGPVFDSSLGTAPFSFTLGIESVIAGFDRGVLGMKEGGTRRLVVPPSLAYGSTRSSVIPPYATLIFEISLVTVQ